MSHTHLLLSLKCEKVAKAKKKLQNFFFNDLLTYLVATQTNFGLNTFMTFICLCLYRDLVIKIEISPHKNAVKIGINSNNNLFVGFLLICFVFRKCN